jgi:hypothetical protein
MDSTGSTASWRVEQVRGEVAKRLDGYEEALDKAVARAEISVADAATIGLRIAEQRARLYGLTT